jgi:hypothetical protein
MRMTYHSSIRVLQKMTNRASNNVAPAQYDSIFALNIYFALFSSTITPLGVHGVNKG